MPPVATLSRVVVPVTRSRTNRSCPQGSIPSTKTQPLVSPITKLLACEMKATTRPSVLIPTGKLPLLVWALLELRLTRVVTPVTRSRTKTSLSPLVSPTTRLLAFESKAT